MARERFSLSRTRLPVGLRSLMNEKSRFNVSFITLTRKSKYCFCSDLSVTSEWRQAYINTFQVDISSKCKNLRE